MSKRKSTDTQFGKFSSKKGYAPNQMSIMAAFQVAQSAASSSDEVMTEASEGLQTIADNLESDATADTIETPEEQVDSSNSAEEENSVDSKGSNYTRSNFTKTF